MLERVFKKLAKLYDIGNTTGTFDEKTLGNMSAVDKAVVGDMLGIDKTMSSSVRRASISSGRSDDEVEDAEAISLADPELEAVDESINSWDFDVLSLDIPT